MAEDAESGMSQSACPAKDAPKANPSRDVFITYATHDLAAASAVCAALESASIYCWMAPRDVTPGDFYGNAIVHAIDASKVTVLLLSEHATASPHVLIEVERAVSKRHAVIALRLDEALRPAAFEYLLNASQWLDALHQNTHAALPRLVESVSYLIAQASGGNSGQAVSEAQAPALLSVQPARGWWKAGAALLGLLVILALGYRTFVVHPEAPNTQKTMEPVFSPPPHSIAVLPLVNLSGVAGQDYLSDGISEELLDSLARLSDLQVVAATSSFSFKGQNLDVPTIARRLNVGAVLEGSFRRVGDKVRIGVQLINSITGFQMWSQTYDRDMVDILKLQSEIAMSVTSQLKIKLVGMVDHLALGETDNPEAYDNYLRGMHLFYQRNTGESGLAQALASFDQAIALDPNYAAAYVRKVAVLISTPPELDGPNSRGNLAKRAREAAERSIVIAPKYGEAHLALAGVLAFEELDFINATHEYRLAAALAPGNAYVQRTFGSWASYMGYFDAGIAAGRRAVTLDPQNFSSHAKLSNILKNARRYDESLAELRNADALVPNTRGSNASVAEILLATGKYRKAREFCESPATPLAADQRSYCLTLAYHALGMNAEAARHLEQYKTEIGELQSYTLGFVYAQLGDTKAALQWLSLAEKQHDPRLSELKQTWEYDPIRKEPGFQALLARIKFPGPNDLTDPSGTVAVNR